MGIFESIVLGLIQGLTEFIPVSSSGHLVIAQVLFSGASDHLFLEWIDLGTFLALVVYFRHRIVSIANDVIVRKKYRLGRNLILTTIPAVVVGLLLGNFIETSPLFGNLTIVAVALGFMGIVMIITDHLPHRNRVKNGEQLPGSRALVVGLFQVGALIPGVSRSGSTIIAGKLMGLSSAEAAEYSFLASLPIMFGLVLKLLLSSDDRHYFVTHLSTMLIGNGVAFVSGLFAVSFLIGYLSRHGLVVFGWYRVILAAGLTAVLLIK